MWTVEKKILFMLYRITAAWLPISRRSSIAKKLRVFWIRKIVRRCGEDINIERNAVFGPMLEIGNGSGVEGSAIINLIFFGKSAVIPA